MSSAADILNLIVRRPGSSDHDIAEVILGSPEPDNLTLVILGSLEHGRLIESEPDVIGYAEGGAPIEGTRYRPTANGTSRALLDYIRGNPGCTDADLDWAFGSGGIAEWVETDIEYLTSRGDIRAVQAVYSTRAGSYTFGRRFYASEGHA